MFKWSRTVFMSTSDLIVKDFDGVHLEHVRYLWNTWNTIERRWLVWIYACGIDHFWKFTQLICLVLYSLCICIILPKCPEEEQSTIGLCQCLFISLNVAVAEGEILVKLRKTYISKKHERLYILFRYKNNDRNFPCIFYVLLIQCCIFLLKNQR